LVCVYGLKSGNRLRYPYSLLLMITINCFPRFQTFPAVPAIPVFANENGTPGNYLVAFGATAMSWWCTHEKCGTAWNFGPLNLVVERYGTVGSQAAQDTRLRSSIKEVVCHLDNSVLGRVYKPPPPHDFHWRKKDLYLSLPRLFKVIR